MPQWWSPDPRAIFEFDDFHVSRRLARTLRQKQFSVTSDRDFAGVIRGCATVGDRESHTWLTPAMIAAYAELSALGYAHSVEVWQAGKLVGGTYGVAIGGFFSAESMFFRARDASKVALANLVRHLKRQHFQLLDIQQLTDHTATLGAVEIPRSAYLERLKVALAMPAKFGAVKGEWQPAPNHEL